MRAYWDAEMPGACDSTLAISDRVQDYGGVFEARDLYPHAEVPDGLTEALWLEHESRNGLMKRGRADDRYRTRLAFELEMIKRLGFSGYFLVVADICREARERGIRIIPRGSANGSLVAYAIGHRSRCRRAPPWRHD